MHGPAARREGSAPARGQPRPGPGRLVETVLVGQIANHLLRGNPNRVGRDGSIYVMPGSGGISLNVRIGDHAQGLVGDHVEPGVSIRNNDRESLGQRDAANRALMALSCIGNIATVISGPAAGSRGLVTGKHGGINHVLVDFAPEVLRRLRIGDRIQISAIGQGMALGLPGVKALNLSPGLLRRWGLRRHGPHLHVPCTHLVPAGLLGSGLGRPDGVLGDCDIQLSEPRVVRGRRLDQLRLGDIVAVEPATFSFGPSRQEGQITYGVVVHGDSRVSGHGPGVTPLLMGPSALLRPTYSAEANLARLYNRRADIAALREPGPRERARWERLHRGQPT